MNERSPNLADSKPYSKGACSNLGNDPKSLRGTTGLPHGDQPSGVDPKPLPRRRWAIGPRARRAPPYSKSACSNFGNEPESLRGTTSFPPGHRPSGTNPKRSMNGTLTMPTPKPYSKTACSNFGNDPKPLGRPPAYLQATGILV